MSERAVTIDLKAAERERERKVEQFSL